MPVHWYADTVSAEESGSGLSVLQNTWSRLWVLQKPMRTPEETMALRQLMEAEGVKDSD